jgi:hypothetical protein
LACTFTILLCNFAMLGFQNKQKGIHKQPMMHIVEVVVE